MTATQRLNQLYIEFVNEARKVLPNSQHNTKQYFTMVKTLDFPIKLCLLINTFIT